MTYKIQIVQLAYEALYLIMLVSAPTILTSMLVGLIVAIAQTATQIQEQTLSFTFKLVAVVLVLMFTGPWVGTELLNYSKRVFTGFYASNG